MANYALRIPKRLGGAINMIKVFKLLSLLQLLAVAVMVIEGCLAGALNAQDLLDLKIPEYRVEQSTMEDALKKLHAWGIRLSLEKVPTRDRRPEEVRVSVDLRGVTIRDVLKALTSADRRYTWRRYQRSFVDTNLINVFPVRLDSESQDLMNIRVKKVVIKGFDSPENALPHIGRLVPELATRLYPGGVAGSFAKVIGGNMQLEIDFEFENMTVREILNEMVLRTPSWGWLYEPTPNPRWRIFP